MKIWRNLIPKTQFTLLFFLLGWKIGAHWIGYSFLTYVQIHTAIVCISVRRPERPSCANGIQPGEHLVLFLRNFNKVSKSITSYEFMQATVDSNSCTYRYHVALQICMHSAASFYYYLVRSDLPFYELSQQLILVVKK